MTKRIIILASERSGTNLLRVLLGNHKDISAPVSVHFFNTFNPSISLYGNIENKENAEKLMNHFVRSANHPYTNWNLNEIDSNLVDKYKVNSFATAFDAIYRMYMEKENKNNYAVKDNNMFNYVDLTEKLKNNGEVYYIHLYRDPRDQAVSWLKTPLFLHTPFDIAKKWNKEQSKIKELKKRLQIFSLSYENLITDTPKVMTALFNYVDMPVDENSFTTDPKNEESKRNELWTNLSKPVLKDNKKKYKELLKGRDLKILETICKQNMLDLGYALDTSANWKDFFGYYKKNILPKKRAINKKENTEFYETKMQDLKSKLNLLEELRNEAQGEKKA